ncbi:MAG: transketolase [Deltaproteobacteria bacterium]|nr:transketolase [Deltaproteobacteria bacterium]
MQNIDELRKQAQKIRISIIEMLTEARSGHPGGSLSATEIVTALYFSEMRHDPKRPKWEERDRFVISKGHGVPAVYAAMAHAGYFPQEELMTLRKTGARLQGHPDPAKLPGMEAATGSLGQGLSIAQGMALAARLSGSKSHTYCLLGDGELQEGQVWEAAMSAPNFKLGGLTAIIDYNGGQIDGPTAEVMNLEPIADKWRAFNWKVTAVDGHDFTQLLPALAAAKKEDPKTGRPHLIVANTVKGKGVSFMEHKIGWHGVAPSKDDCAKACEEIRSKLV